MAKHIMELFASEQLRNLRFKDIDCCSGVSGIRRRAGDVCWLQRESSAEREEIKPDGGTEG